MSSVAQQTERPISELVNLTALRAMSRSGVMRDRRLKDRFACRVPAVLEVSGKEFPAECLDVSTGGARITTHRPVLLAVGQPVKVRIRVGTQLFATDYLVARLPRLHNTGITLHLKVAQTADVVS